jgi:hypothetical protein
LAAAFLESGLEPLELESEELLESDELLDSDEEDSLLELSLLSFISRERLRVP